LTPTPTLDEPGLAPDTPSPYATYAESLHATAATSPEPEATLAAEMAMRNFPNAPEAVARPPRPRATPTSGPTVRKKLIKRLKR
jgi:hypothetical protein